ncbi:MAG: TIGR00730 family Rossman fold protein [Bacteroidales bacterium]|nr:TIGR00730 family Rossman fold protein [Bacteroidales bacterium]
MSRRICVYCSSSDILEDRYKEVAYSFAEAASSHNCTLVCGGSRKGLMGVMIDTFISSGGTVEGVMPEFMKELEFYHPDLSSITFVQTMSERKKLMRQDTDAVVALPGGLGTLEEFLETYTLKRLGLYSGDVILLNVYGFFKPLLELFEHFVDNKVLNTNWKSGLKIVDSVEELIEVIDKCKPEILSPRHYAPE